MIRRDLILGRRINNPSARFSIPLDCIRPLFILFISHGRELHSLKKNKMVHSRSELQGNSEFSVNDMLHRVANSSLVSVRVQKLRYLFHVFSTLNRERIAWINFES